MLLLLMVVVNRVGLAREEEARLLQQSKEQDGSEQ